MQKVKFENIFEDVTKHGRKIPTNCYLQEGQFPIIDQGQNEIAGYTNDNKGIFANVPVIVFGDHTRIIKYIKTPFFLGADGVKVLKPILGNVDYKYLYYFLSNVSIPDTGYNRHFKWLKEVEIPLPPIEDQKVIAERLDKVSELIEKRKEQIKKLDLLIKSRFLEMFGDKLNEDTLLNLCNIIDYRGKTPEKVESGLPFITAKNIKMHQFNMDPREYISKETYDKVMVRGFPKEGDVVFTTEAPLGNVCRIPFFETKFYIGQRIVTFQTTKLNPIYLEYALDTDGFRKKLAEKASGSTVTGVRVRLLEQLTIPVPSIELQNQFAEFVEQVDKLKVVVKTHLEKLETLKKSLMQQYFR